MNEREIKIEDQAIDYNTENTEIKYSIDDLYIMPADKKIHYDSNNYLSCAKCGSKKNLRNARKSLFGKNITNAEKVYLCMSCYESVKLEALQMFSKNANK